MDTEMPVEFAVFDPVIVATVRTPLLTGGMATERVVEQLKECARGSRPIHLLLDFHRVSRVSVPFLAELRSLRRAVELGGGTLRLCAMPKEVRQVLEVFDLERLYFAGRARHALPKYTAYLGRKRKIRSRPSAATPSRL